MPLRRFLAQSSSSLTFASPPASWRCYPAGKIM
uniref:Uncharacterized protein n=1 Tax=Arundo donax TaxID=35708 RepID=A0A0A8Y561_ARUDO